MCCFLCQKTHNIFSNRSQFRGIYTTKIRDLMDGEKIRDFKKGKKNQKQKRKGEKKEKRGKRWKKRDKEGKKIDKGGRGKTISKKVK